MSLINKMLSDLEQRHSYRKDHDEMVLGGLAPVANTGFTMLKLPYNFLLICFFVVAVGLAIYGYRQDTAQPMPLPASVSFNPPEPAATDMSDQTAVQQIEVAPALKLDLSLPPVATAGQVDANRLSAGIDTVSIVIADAVTTLQLHIDRNVQYRVNTLENPHRIVLEIDNASLRATVPMLANHPYIEQLQFSNPDEKVFQLIAVTKDPVRISNAGMQADSDGYLLSISLYLDAGTALESIPIVDELLVTEESGYGQMDIRPAADSNSIPSAGLLDNARTAYAGRDYGKGDAVLLAFLEQDPLHLEARTLYAGSLVSRGNVASAKQVLAAGLDMNPGASEWAMQYARLLVNEDRTTDAVMVLRRSLPSIENNEDYYAFYAALLQRTLRHEEAVGYYGSLLQRDPDNGLWWMGLAISQEGMRNSEGALRSYNRALQAQSLNPELQQYVSKQIERLGKL